MKHNEIVEIAKQAGIETDWSFDFQVRLETFANLLAQHAKAEEREACAKVCDELQDVPATEPRHCAEDIRARGDNK
jgi:hypothetical protein